MDASMAVGDIRYYHFAPCTYAGIEGCLAARTGYTGEDGFELFVPAAQAEAAWARLMGSGERFGIQPIGLGARDTLRLESCFRLYGNDMNEQTTPFEAGLGWVTKLKKETPFVGQEALRTQRREGVPRRLVALVVEKRIPRPHCPILHEGQIVGEVTSGTRSPSLETSVALGYVPTPLAKPGTAVQIDVRGRLAEAQVVRAPFYSRDY
jgi:aminomethyltransferase